MERKLEQDRQKAIERQRIEREEKEKGEKEGLQKLEDLVSSSIIDLDLECTDDEEGGQEWPVLMPDVKTERDDLGEFGDDNVAVTNPPDFNGDMETVQRGSKRIAAKCNTSQGQTKWNTPNIALSEIDVRILTSLELISQLEVFQGVHSGSEEDTLMLSNPKFYRH